MTTGVLYIVPSDRQVERLARGDLAAETRGAFRDRLAKGLLPDVAFSERHETRLALGAALSDPAFSGAAQLHLFGSRPPTAGDALLESMRERGGASWIRVVAAVDRAIGGLRGRGATAEHLRKLSGPGVTVARATMLAEAMDLLDRRLTAAGLVDGRLIGRRLASAIGSSSGSDLARVVGSKHLRSRWLMVWDHSDLAWWRALDEVLGREGGWARIVLPAFDRPLEGRRERDPFDEIADDVAASLDAAPETELVQATLGDLTAAGLPVDPTRVSVIRASDGTSQARDVAEAIHRALRSGTVSVDRVAVGLPKPEERTLAPLRRAFDDVGVVFHELLGDSSAAAPVVAAALLALDAAGSLERFAVAQLLRSGYVDGRAFASPDLAGASVRHLVSRLADKLETRATAAGSDPADRLVRTVGADATAEAGLLRGIVAELSVAAAAVTRGERIEAARRLWKRLGIADRAGAGGLFAFGRDDAPTGVFRAEQLAIARDARAWEALTSALDAAAHAGEQLAAMDQPMDGASFRAELLDLLEESGSRPSAGRVAAVRVGRIDQFVGEELDLFIVLDVNEGLLPADDATDSLVSSAMATALVRASRGACSTPPDGLARARSLASLAVAAAEAQRIRLVFTGEDASGAPLAPSALVDLLVRGGLTVGATSAEVVVPPHASAAARAERERIRETFFLDPSRPRSDIVGQVTVVATPFEDILRSETGGGSRALAITALERFAKCAFMGFAQVVLGARETEHREELPDAREEGTVVHEALAAAFSATTELWRARPRDAAAILTGGLAAAEVILAGWEGHAALRTLVRLRIREGVRAVLAAAIDDETWDFAAAEQPFGSPGAATTAWPAMTLAASDESLVLRGTIDRVDLAHDGRSIRVIDYKRSGSTVRESMRTLGETSLQVPLYACVASRASGLPATGLYLPTQPRDVAREERMSAKAEQRLGDLVSRAAPGELAAIELRSLELVTAARRGRLVPVPADEGVCRTCSVSGGCRKPRFAMAAAEDTEDSL